MNKQYSIPEQYTLFREDLEHVLTYAESAFNALADAHILLTGANGLFGGWILESLLWARQRLNLRLHVTALMRSPHSWLAERGALFAGRAGLEIVAGDVRDFCFPAQCSHLIHTASASFASPAEHIDTALRGVSRVLDFADYSKAEAVLLASSGGAYLGVPSQQADGTWVEPFASASEALTGKNVYGECKRMMELMAIARGGKSWRAIAARCFAFVGPWLPLNANYAVGNFMADVLAKRAIVVNGDGSALRSYLYLADLVVWLITMLVNGKHGTVCNVGGDQALSIRDLAETVARIANGAAGVTVLETPVPGSRPDAYLPSLVHAHQELGLFPIISLEDGIRRTLAWYRMQNKTG